MSSPFAEREINRARHSGLLNPTVFHLQDALNGVLSQCACASQLNSEDLSTLPEATLELLLTYLRENAASVDNKTRQLQRGKEELTKLQHENETLRDLVIKEQNNALFVRDKCDALAEQQRQVIG